jgi:hypothetical protein
MSKNVVAVMQPYFFPYIGYFQLINAADKFIFYDDVNYIKGGWINRNNVLVKGEKKYITLSLVDSSSFKKINEIYIGDSYDKVLKTIKQSYAKAPYFNEALPVIEDVFSGITSKSLISEIAAKSVVKVSEYLDMKTVFELSSAKYFELKDLERERRLIEICKYNNARTYINAIGGKDLYSKNTFKDNNIELLFLESKISEYKQFDNSFEPALSIIDVIMFNSVNKIKSFLEDYKLK